jgi:hypothetical protein
MRQSQVGFQVLHFAAERGGLLVAGAVRFSRNRADGRMPLPGEQRLRVRVDDVESTYASIANRDTLSDLSVDDSVNPEMTGALLWSADRASFVANA